MAARLKMCTCITENVFSLSSIGVTPNNVFYTHDFLLATVKFVNKLMIILTVLLACTAHQLALPSIPEAVQGQLCIFCANLSD